MDAVESLTPAGESKEEGRPRERSSIRFPSYDLADSVYVAKVIHEKGGGVVTADQLAAYLDYKSTNNGAYLARVGAAKLFGLISGQGRELRLTTLAQKILMPIYQGQEREGLVEAFLNVPLFKAVFEEHQGRELPPEFGMKNLFRLKFQIVPGRVDVAYRMLMDSADTAGFFTTRAAKTHLILPPMQQPPAAPKAPEQNVEQEERETTETGGGGGSGGNQPPKPPAIAKSAEDLKATYVAALIDILREKGPDADLMERIEKLLGVNA